MSQVNFYPAVFVALNEFAFDIYKYSLKKNYYYKKYFKLNKKNIWKKDKNNKQQDQISHYVINVK